MALVSAVVVAAGTGSRMGSDLPKQFLQLAGRTVLYHTLKNLSASTLIKEIIIVVAAEYLDSPELAQSLPVMKIPVRSIAGGARRQDSVLNGIKATDAKTDIVLIQDGVRPFVTPEYISQSIAACREADGAIVAIQAFDTLKQSASGLTLEKTIDRSAVYQAQTPQTFRKKSLIKAYENAQKTGYIGTDEASLLEQIGGSVKLIPGSRYNLKITTPEDLIIASFIAGQDQF